MKWFTNKSVLKVSLALFTILSLGPLTPGHSEDVSLSERDDLKTVLVAPPPDEAGALAPRIVLSSGGGSGSSSDESEFAIGGNVQVSRNQNPALLFRSGNSETTIAGVDDGEKLIAGWNDGEGFAFAPFGPRQPARGLSGFGVSFDGGRTWRDSGTPPIDTIIGLGPGPRGRSATGRYVTRGDPWLAVGTSEDDDHDDATVFYSNLAVWEDDANLPPAGVSVHRGSFSDHSFAFRDAVLLQSPNYPRDFVDKNAIAARGQNVAVTLTNFIETCNTPLNGFGQIELYRSPDGGTTWSRTIVQRDETFITDPTVKGCGDDGIVNQGSAPEFGPHGDLFITWERGWIAPIVGGGPQGLPRATIAFRKVDEQGRVGPLRTVRSICSSRRNPPAGFNRTSFNDFPRIAVAHKGRFSGRIFIAFQDCSATNDVAPFGRNTDVYVAFSDDQGATWSSPVPVSPQADGNIHFWPVVNVTKGGEVTVVYSQSREVKLNPNPDPNFFECVVRIGGPLNNPTLRKNHVSSLVDVFLARSKNGGQTFEAPMKVTTQTTNWCKATPLNSIIPNFGDYIGGRGAGSKTLITWADGRNGGLIDRVPTVFFAPAESE